MRKGQEEIVGFVVVVVLISIVGLIFLVFSLRPSVETRESVTVEQFLGSAMEYTSDCSLNGREFIKIKQLINECNQESYCVDGKSSCEVLNQTMGEIIVEGLKIGPDRPYQGYSLESFYRPYNSSYERTSVISMELGNCTSGKLSGTTELQPSEGGSISTTLEVCD